MANSIAVLIFTTEVIEEHRENTTYLLRRALLFTLDQISCQLLQCIGALAEALQFRKSLTHQLISFSYGRVNSEKSRISRILRCGVFSRRLADLL